MSFQTFIKCDDMDCNSQVEVPQPGALAPGWVFVQFMRQNVAIAGNGNRQPQGMNQMVGKTFCSWRCANRLTKSFVQEGAKK